MLQKVGIMGTFIQKLHIQSAEYCYEASLYTSYINTFGATRATNNNAVLSASLWAHKAADVTGIGRQPRATET